MEKKFTVLGMSCTACSSGVERAVKKISGVNSANVSLTQKLLVVEGDFSVEEVKKAVKSLGFKIFPYGEETENKQSFFSKYRLLISVILLLIVTYFSMSEMLKLPNFNFLKGVSGAIYLIVLELLLSTIILLLNYKFFVSGFKAVKNLSPNMDTLVALGSGASYVFGVFALVMVIVGSVTGNEALIKTYLNSLYFDGACMIVAFVSIGKFLEERSKEKTESAVEKLKSLAPDEAVVLVGGNEVKISVNDLKISDVIVIKQGNSVPADAVIISGDGEFDESLLTGESLPVYKEVGGVINTATVCVSGYITARVERVKEDTVFSKIINYVLSAEASKAPVQRLADKISKIFVPTVVAISLITLIVWLIIGKPFDFAFSRAVSVLVISCPCALGLATPVAVTVATGKSASFGALIKDAKVLQKLADINVVVLDKTGTVTEGKLKVGKVVGLTEAELLDISSIEKLSSHPIATAITEFIPPKDFEVLDFLSVTGRGVKGVVNGNKYIIGNKNFLALCEFSDTLLNEANLSLNDGKSVLYVAKNGVVIGFMEIYDMVKPTSKQAISKLNEMGVKTVILSGDSESVCNRVKMEVGAKKVFGGVLPEEKAKKVEEYKTQNKVIFVGDGVNDSPALSVADVGVAMSSGTDILFGQAGVILLSNDLNSVVKVMKTAKKSQKIIKQNLFWALIYNVVGIPLASGALYFLGLLLNPMIASLFMSLSSLIVVTNALRIYKDEK